MSFASAECAPAWVLAARVELRRGAILRRKCAPGGSGIAEEDSVLFAAIEMMRSEDAPKIVFLLSEHHIHLYQIAAEDPSQATVLVAPRASNLGLLLSELRQVVQGLEQ